MDGKWRRTFKQTSITHALKRRGRMFFLPAIILLWISLRFYRDLVDQLLVRTTENQASSQSCALSNRTWPPNNQINFSAALESRAGPYCDIILTLVGENSVDMAFNLYLTSFKTFDLKNVLFVGTERKVCDLMAKRHLPCTVFKESDRLSQSSKHASTDFHLQTKTKISMLTDTLNLGYSLATADVDAILFQDPMPHFKNNADTDIVVLDSEPYNPGIMYLRPTFNGKRLYKEMLALIDKNINFDEQKAMNTAIQKFVENREIKIGKLSPKLFLNGVEYFERGNHSFPSSYNGCVAMHTHNWGVSKEAKVFTFKEHYLWKVDDKGYYSSISNKYIVYENPFRFKKLSDTQQREIELAALKSALTIANILNRTLILPRFHCGGKLCLLDSIVNVATFDKQFGSFYRESTFLSNTLTPKLLINHWPIVIMTPGSSEILKVNEIDTDKLSVYHSPTNIVRMHMIKVWLGRRKEAVLRFHSMYHVRIGNNDDVQFERRLESGLQPR